MLCNSCKHRIAADRLRCPSCGRWQIANASIDDHDGTKLLSDASIKETSRIVTGPWDPCFGGGIVLGATVLIGGAPGAGKSTLALQLADVIATQSGEVLYVATEESSGQIRDRALRLKVQSLSKIRMACTKDGFQASLKETLLTRKPKAIIVDSLTGLVGTDLEAAAETCDRLKDYATELNCPALVIDHVTKQGDFAGLMKLQHVVDTTISFFPHEPGCETRGMTTVKNRFGPNTSLCLVMLESGLQKCTGCRYCSKDDDEE
jgi:DNA repair protein RadA/Sms